MKTRKNQMKLKYIIYAVVVLGILLLGYFLFFTGTESPSEEKARSGSAPVQVEAVIVHPRSMADTLKLTGSIDADEKIEVRSEVSGIVERIYFNEGSRVSKGQVLVKINDVELQAQLRQAETRRQLTSENERRARLLLDRGAISQEEYDIASADFKTAQAQIQLIRAQISKTTVRAPFSGVIGLRNISPGAYISPDMLITSLVKSNRVKITFSIPEKYAGMMKVNTLIYFTVANQAETFNAKVYAIQPEIEINTRTLTVRAQADNSQGKLIPGTFANIAFDINETDDALMVPSEAIVPVQNGKKVFVYKSGKAKEIMVETGSRNRSDVVVLSGLNPSDTVLTTGVLNLKEGTSVSISIKPNKTAL
ncbi:MAG: efflux RND transporter periplasmic adaptor subunit [Moheibacter sp.]